MTEPMAILLSATVAFFMVALARSGASADLRAAIRTTVVVALGWGFAYARYGLNPGPRLSWQVQGMLLASVLAVAFAWLFRFRANQRRSVSNGSVIDRVNFGFALVIATLFVSGNLSAQSMMMALILVVGAAVLAFGSR